MSSFLKNKLFAILFAVLFIIWCIHPLYNVVDAVGSNAPKYEEDFAAKLKEGKYVLNPQERFSVGSGKTLRQNIVELFYLNVTKDGNYIYKVIRGITLWVMIIFIVMAWASLLLNKKPDEAKKHMLSVLYILLWWVFIYAANRLFWSVLHFNSDLFTLDIEWESQQGIWWFTRAFIWKWSVMFVILSAIKAFAFFLAIIMIVVTWIKVMAAWEWEKWRKLIKWLINVVVALLIIKWVDFIYYLAADSSTFVKNTSDLIINAATVFAWIYWVIVFIMVLVAWYLYITDWWDWSSFKEASNVLVNILLSALVLFWFLLITYQIFAEFQTWWDAVTESVEEWDEVPGNPVIYVTTE